jgi:hypothetical protein
MRLGAVLLLVVAGCARVPPEEAAAAICQRQGLTAGTAEFRACWNAVFPAVTQDRAIRAAAASMP